MELKYSFKYIECCNLCGAKSPTNKILGKRLNKSQGKFPKKQIGISTTIQKCIQCGLIYTNPQPLPANIQDHYCVSPEKY